MTEIPLYARSRQAARLFNRRVTSRAVAGSGLAALLSMLAGAEAKKKRKRNKKRKKKPAPTCAEQCPGIDACFSRPVGPPLCGDFFSRGECVPCDSDQDCVEASNPYCLIDLTQASNSETRRFSDCGDYAVGLCTSISVVT